VQNDSATIDQKPQQAAIPQSQVDEFVLLDPLPYTTLVLDLGDVFAFYSANGLDLPVKAATIGRMLRSSAWAELECGRISRSACLSRICQDFGSGAKPKEIEDTLQLLAGTLQYNIELVNLVRYIKSTSGGQIQVYLATNITAQDWEILRPAVESWQIFDGIFPSFELGARKPQGRYFQQLLNKINVSNPGRVLFVDDKPDTIVAARVSGLGCIQYIDKDKTIAAIKNAFGNATARGEAWLRAHAGKMWSETNTGVTIYDTFAQLMILENSADPNLVTLPEKKHRTTWNFFHSEPTLTSSDFPDDLDTTSLALWNVASIGDETKHAVMDQMLKHMDEDGLFNTYFSPTRFRADIHITANVLRTFYAHGRADKLRKTISYMIAVARTRAYTNATIYYLHPDWFFYHLSELFALASSGTSSFSSASQFDANQQKSEDKDLEKDLAELQHLLRDRLSERLGDPEHCEPWSLALRLVAARNLGLFPLSSSETGTEARMGAGVIKDLERLRASQGREGSFGADNPWIYRYRNGMLIGNVGLVTAVAVRALKGLSSSS